jgi:predicted DCC family thiol-disulfide oxidoreductase YuxK
MAAAERNEHPVLLFDGTCALCNGTVQFVLDHERDQALRFAPLQSETASRLLAPHGLAVAAEPETIVLVEAGRAYTHSAAALRVAAHLRWPWRLAGALVIVPRVLRDLAYRFVARNRYRWFGREEVCRLPSPEHRVRFLGG